jgi:hypothetical protein
VITTWSVTGLQPAKLLVNVNVTVPLLISFAPAVYVEVKLLALLNVPSPLVVHVVVPELELPANVTVALFAHTLCGVPASTTGAGLNVITIWSVTALQPARVELNVKVTLPLLISVALGVYVVFTLLFGEKVPVPLVVHKIVVPATSTVPVRVTTALFEHKV